MISESKLRELLNENVAESLTLDFKSELHRLDNDYFKSLFIKDILSMTNTPREETSYIVIGVKANPDGTMTPIGVLGDHPDDADLHKFLNLAKVDPKPEFSYQTIRLDGLSYGVIEFPLKKDGPYLPTTKFGVLDPFRLYFRRGSGNDEASPHEQNQIYHWFHSAAESAGASPSAEVKFPHWPEFALACHYFDKDRLYLFILGPSNETPDYVWKFLARLPLSLVLDFDPETSSAGAYKHIEPELKNIRFPHLLTLKDEYSLVPEKACYWYGARGLTERKRSLISSDAGSKTDSGWRKWNRTYASALDKLIEDFARASRGLPLTVVCLWYAPEYVREVCSIIDRKFDDAVNYVFAVSEAERLETLAYQFNADLVSMSLENVLCGIPQYIEPVANSSFIEASVPRLDNTGYFLSQSDLLWLSEDLDILHSAIEKEEFAKDERIEGEFLKGWTISWEDLSSHADGDREATSNILDQVKYDLKSRTSVRYSLYHWPGAGGTTVARRVAWELHRQFPTVLLRHITPGETIGRFRMLFNETEQSIFAVVEGAEVTPDHLEKLYTEVQAENIPVVFLIVSRRFEVPSFSVSKPSERTAFISQLLSRDESTKFADIYKRAAPERAGMLEMLRNRNLRERTPFIFALTAFEENFVGVSKFVQSRLEVATETQRDILKFIALVYFFAHRPLNVNIFATQLNQLKSQLLRLERRLGEPQLELLVKEGSQKWRPIHQLIAEEIVVSTLAGEGDRRVWWAGLSTLAIEFIKLCQDGSSVYDDDLIETLRRIFIQKDEQELLGTEKLDVGSPPKFARLIEEVRYQDGQQLIFEQLVASFPQEPHFWGHLGRFYSIQKKSEEALEAINEALRLSPEDPLLHHMKGMCYCRIAFEKMSILWFKPQTEEEKKLLTDGEIDIKEVIEDAKDSFGASRSLDPTSEHAYISQIQLLLRALDFGYSTSIFQKRTDFLISPGSVWYRDQLDEATYLMDQLKMLREGERPSQLIKKYQEELDEIDGDQSHALERWNDLLAQARVFAPPIRRQIVRAYLARRKHDWASLPPKEIERIVTLMEQNIKEEPRSDYNIRYWFRAIRYSINQNITVALDRVTNWKTIGDSLEATYYLYVLYVLLALDGDTTRLGKTEELINQSMERSRNLGKRTRSFEWLGEGTGLRRLKHYSELDEWDEEKNFYSNTTGLARVEGVVTKYRGPGAGTIEIASCGLPVFFVPAKVGIERGKHTNVRVKFYLGFSYSGLRAWSVELIK